MRPLESLMLRSRPTAPALAALLLGLLPSGCERRIEEPIVPAHSSDARLQTPREVSGAASPAADAGATKGRCIRKTPDAPVRALLRGGGADPACPDDPTGPFKLRTGRISFVDAKAPDVNVEIARRDEERSRGLMYRKSMPESHGMLFVFEERVNHTFWMHNTCIQLDMLFIDSDGTIVGIEENTPTLNDSTFEVGCPSTYVLELNAGWARRHGVMAGQKVKFDGL
jgi:uncharacterized protein